MCLFCDIDLMVLRKFYSTPIAVCPFQSKGVFVTKLDKSIDLNEILFNDEIEEILDVKSNI